MSEMKRIWDVVIGGSRSLTHYKVATFGSITRYAHYEFLKTGKQIKMSLLGEKERYFLINEDGSCVDTFSENPSEKILRLSDIFN